MNIAFFGAGTMGAPMAQNIAAAGHEVTVWNRTPERAQELTGVASAEERAAAIHGCAALITMLADAEAVISAVEDVLDEVPLWIQMSTIGIAGTERCVELAERAGTQFVDAPVLGTKGPAEKGELVVLCSGPEDAREQCLPLLDAVGRKTLWLGEAGSGTRLKLVTNAWILALVEGIAETFKLAGSLGVDPADLLDAVDGGPLDAGYLRLKGGAIMDHNWDPSFALRLARKDADLVGDAAAQRDLELPLLSTVAARLAAAVDAGHGEEDVIALYKAL